MRGSLDSEDVDQKDETGGGVNRNCNEEQELPLAADGAEEMSRYGLPRCDCERGHEHRDADHQREEEQEGGRRRKGFVRGELHERGAEGLRAARSF